MIQGTQSVDQVIVRPAGAARWLRRWPLWILGAGFLALGMWGVPTVGRWLSTDRSALRSELRFATVERGDLERDLGVEGQVVAARHPTVFSPARGIVSLEVKAGQTVAAGEVLARVASPELASELLRERSALAALESELEGRRLRNQQTALQQALEIEQFAVRAQAAERAVTRAERIYREGLVNVIELERAQDDVKLARQSLEHARQRATLDAATREVEVRNATLAVERQLELVRERQRQVDELAVRAPLTGQVGRLEVADRDAVVDGQPLLSVVDLSAFVVDVEIPESYGDEVTPGVAVALRVDGQDYPGQVLRLSPAVQAGVVRGQVGFAAALPPGLRQAQRVACRLLLDRRENVVKVARGPFVEGGGARFVYVVDGDVARRRRVEIGATSVREVEIRAGLEPGEVLILSDTTRFEEAESVLLR